MDITTGRISVGPRRSGHFRLLLGAVDCYELAGREEKQFTLDSGWPGVRAENEVGEAREGGMEVRKGWGGSLYSPGNIC